MRRALAIDEASYGPEHPDVAVDLNNLAQLLKATNRLSEAEPLSRRVLIILSAFSRQGYQHHQLQAASKNYASLLVDMWGCPNSMDRSHATISATLSRSAWRPSKATGVEYPMEK